MSPARPLPACRPTRRRVLAAAAALSLSAAGPAGAREAGAPDPALLARLRRGTNLSTWTDEGGARGGRSADLRRLRSLGLTHIRLPVDDEALADPSYLARLDAQLARLLDLGFAVSVDLHPGARLHTLYRERPEAALDAALAAWSTLAPLLAPLPPAVVAAELLNEPPTDADTWARHLPRLAGAVRRHLPRHTLVAGPAGPQRHEALEALTPLIDHNVVYAVHYYDPFAFTHQGADWDGTGAGLAALGALPFPARAGDPAMCAALARLPADARRVLSDALLDDWTEAGIRGAFARIGAWSRRNGRPVVVNEFGVLADRAPRAARLAWLAAVTAAAEAEAVGWTHWDFADGFGLLDADGRLDEAALRALADTAAPAFAEELR